jgi:uncharacterized protein
VESFRVEVGAPERSVTALVYRADEPIGATLLLAHGAGVSQRHRFMTDMAARIARRGIDVVTFDFLYMEEGRKMPDRTALLESTWRAVLGAVRARVGLPTAKLFIGGKSMGGRMATNIAAQDPALAVNGLVLLGYPLHPTGKPKVRRDEHLPRIRVPLLFVQGSRDELGTAAEVTAVAKKLKRARVHVVIDGDHSLALPRRAGDDAQEEALSGAAEAILAFVRGESPKKKKAKRRTTS